MTLLIPEPKRHHAMLRQKLAAYRARADERVPLLVEGRLTRIVGLTLEAVGCQAPIGGRCLIAAPDGDYVEAEVVGFAGDRLYLMPTSDMRGLVPNARVIPTQQVCAAPAGMGLLGRVLDGAGQPLDGKGP